VLATVGQVASSIVHDFKNGLFVIGGHAQLMAVKDVDPNAQHHLRQIIGTVDRLSLLSAEILEYSKAREPHCETVDLPAYLGGLLEPYQPRAMETSVSLRCAGPACAAFLDRHRFARVVENLVANSLDALAGQGGGQVTVAWSEDGDGVQITVTDTGKGIPRKVLKRIFEPFFSHGKSKGTGLGMATARKILEEHGGSIQVESEEGKGTQVTLHLPGPRSKPAQESGTGKFQTLGEGQ